MNNTLLTKALKPFADFADPHRRVPSHFPITQGSSMAKKQLTMGDCYAAKEALTNQLVDFDSNSIDPSKAISFTYKNYRGETDVRTVVVLDCYWGQTEWHPKPGYLLRAFDLGKKEIREFSLSDCNFTSSKESS